MEVTSKNSSEAHNIELLPEDVANQIAAGEVVERPSSMVKELVENAIDAESTEITLDIQNGGRTIRITDNGKGIASEQLQLAFRRFATSKIKKESDLWALSTMGFRGEALASIASIAKVEMQSRTRNDAQGTKITVHGNVVLGTEPVGCSYGTIINVEELFYNTPARLKFLKSDSTEISHILELMNAFALAHPQIAFSVFSKSREVLRTHGGNSTLLDVVRQIYGKEIADNLVEVEHGTPYGYVNGLVSKQTYCRGDRNKQIFFVNNRWVKIPFMSRILDEVYKDLLPSHKYPLAILNTTLVPSEIDVNVHPTKKEVRFHSQSSVYELIYRGIINALYASAARNENSIQVSSESEVYNNETNYVNNTVNSEIPSRPEIETSFIRPPSKLEPVYPTNRKDDFKASSTNYNPTRFATPPKEGTYQVQQFSFYDELRDYRNTEENREDLESIKPIGRIYETYIIGYLGNDICFIDQHLAHERYLYEQLELDIKSNQILLTPIVINFSDAEWDNYKENKEIFQQYGYEIEEFGNKTIIMRTIPSIFELGEAEIIFRQMLEDLINEEGRKKSLDKLTHLKKTIACKAAIKAGKSLEMEEIKILVKNWAKTKQPYTCPHGRPVIYRMPKNDIDKHFNRTW